MEKKMKWWKVILIIVLVMFAIYSYSVLRKMVIISELQAKLDKYQTESNVYKKVSSDDSSLKSYERYYKDGVNKEVMSHKESGAVITQYTYLDKRKTFWNTPTGNIYSVYNETTENRDYPVFIDYLTNGTVLELFLIGKNKITTEDLNGKKCYVITGKDIPNIMIDSNATKTMVYIEKDTGIILQVTSVIEEDGSKKEKSIKYDYNIGTVTDEDMKEPDTKDYKLVQY